MNNNDFAKMHNPNRPLTLLNVWNKDSAKALQHEKIKVVASSSYGSAADKNKEDGQQVSLNENVGIFSSLTGDMFRSLDFEAGYSDNSNSLQSNIKYLIKNKISGINLEDKLPGENELQAIEKFTEKINLINHTDIEKSMFVNIRTYSFFSGDLMIKNQNKELLKETIDRINQYEKHAIDGIFILGLKNKEFISTIARNISVPLNIMLDIQSDKLEEYLSIGISRISFGPSTFLEFNHTNFTIEDYFKQKIDQISYLENNKLINLARG